MQITPTVKALLIMNLIIFILTAMVFPEAMLQFSLYDFESSKFRGYQLLTHMFLHAGWGHLFSNMFSLFIFGPMLEYRWGGNRFLIFYLVCGLGASMLYQGMKTYDKYEMKKDMVEYIADPNPVALSEFLEHHAAKQYNPQYVIQFKNHANDPRFIEDSKRAVESVYKNQVENTPMMGASGAVFGILMAFGMLFPNTELMLLFFPFPIKAKYFVFFYGLYELYTGLARNPGDNVAHFAHLGGMLFAFILLKFWERHDRKNFY